MPDINIAKRDPNRVTAMLFVGSDGLTYNAQGDETTGRLKVDASGSTSISIGETVTSGTPGSVLFVGTGPVLAQDNANFFFDDTNNRLGLTTAAPTHTLTLSSASTGIALYNTADQTTNYERGLLSWSANVLTLSSTKGGTGTNRALTLTANGGSFTINTTSSSTSGVYNFGASSTGANSNSVVIGGNHSQSSGTLSLLAITSTISQSSTAGYVGILVNPTESTTGSGTKNLIELQVGSVDRFMVDNTGLTTINNVVDNASQQLLALRGNRATPTTNDEIYQSFFLNNASSATKEFGRITSVGSTITAGAENGVIALSVMVAGTLTKKVQLSSTSWSPSTNDGSALGTTSNSWADLFLASGGVINFNNGNETITHASGSLTVNADLRVSSVGTGSTGVVTNAGTQTLTNKRRTRRLTTVNAPGATPTTNTDNVDIQNFTGLAANITSMTTNLTGTPVDGDLVEFRFTDNGTPRTIAWGASFAATTIALPTTTVTSTMLRVGFEWNGTVWQCIATC